MLVLYVNTRKTKMASSSQKHSDSDTSKDELMESNEECEQKPTNQLRVSGKRIINTKGKVIGAISTSNDCKCRRQCYVNVTEPSRQALFQNFHNLKSHSEQNAYLFPLIRRTEIKRKRNLTSNRRSCTFNYFVILKRNEVQICKEAFANIHGISENKIRVICGKIEQNILDPSDERGRHDNRPNKVSVQTTQLIKHHINSIIQSDNVSQFIHTPGRQSAIGLSISKMWKHFCQFNDLGFKAKSMEPVIKRWVYYRVFNEYVKTNNIGKDLKLQNKKTDEKETEMANNSISEVNEKQLNLSDTLLDINSSTCYSIINSCDTDSILEPSALFPEPLPTLNLSPLTESDYQVFNFDNSKKYEVESCFYTSFNDSF